VQDYIKGRDCQPWWEPAGGAQREEGRSLGHGLQGDPGALAPSSLFCSLAMRRVALLSMCPGMRCCLSTGLKQWV
jgi:hypothetical protein